MAGHSKWKNIQHRKGRQDAVRGRVFTKLIREITVASRVGGPDPSTNPRLRLVMDKAFSANMPKDTVERAIARGQGSAEGEAMQEMIYEGYAPPGIALMVTTLSDNRNRTVAEVRHALTKHGGQLGTEGSVAYLFERRGELELLDAPSEDTLTEWVIESGADDFKREEEGTATVICAPALLSKIKEALEALGARLDRFEVNYHASVRVSLNAEQAKAFLELHDMLMDLDDVQEVYSNADIPDDVLASLE